MITGSDKSEYVEAIRVNSEAEASYAKTLPRILGQNTDFKNRLVRSHWKYVKSELKQSENPRTLVEAGDLYLLRNNYRKAVEYYTRSLEIDPDNISAYEKIILAYSLHNQLKEVDRYFKKLLELTQNRIEILRNYASFKLLYLLKENGDVSEVLSIIDKVIASNPSDFEMISMRGFVVLNLNNDVSGAKDYFKKALAIRKDHIHSLNNLGVCYIREENISEAKKYLEQCITIDPYTYPHSYQNLALIYLKENDYKKTYEILSEAIANKVPIEAEWNHLSGWLLIQLSRYDEAKNWYINKVKEEPSNDLLFNNLGFCYRVLMDIDNAEVCFTKAVSLLEGKLKRSGMADIRSVKAYYNLARLAIDRRDSKTIRNISDKILRLNSKDPFGLYLAGVSLSMQMKYKEAVDLYKQALEINPQIREVYPDYAFILECIENKCEEAIELLEKAIELGFNSPLVSNNLAYAHIRLGHLNVAEKILKKYQEDPHPFLVATRGFLEMRRGNIKEGNILYKEAEAKLDKINRKVAIQMRHLENARHFFKEGAFSKAKEHIRLSRMETKSHLDKEILSLEKEIDTALSKVNIT